MKRTQKEEKGGGEQATRGAPRQGKAARFGKSEVYEGWSHKDFLQDGPDQDKEKSIGKKQT